MDKAITYKIELCTQGSCDFIIKDIKNTPLWFNQLTLNASPPSDSNSEERLQYVVNLLRSIEMRPFENISGYEKLADECFEELNEAIKELSDEGINYPYVHRGKITLVIRGMLPFHSDKL